MPGLLLMDTDIISQMGKPRPPPGLRPWLQRVGTANLAICYPVIAELMRGAHLLQQTDPEKADRISEWVAKVRATDFVVLDMTLEVAAVYARLTSTPALKHLWIPNPQMKRSRLGHDLMVAAISVTYEVPIITGNFTDFLKIDKVLSLPGVYQPMTGTWHIEPSFPVLLPEYRAEEADPTVGLLPVMAPISSPTSR